MSHTLTTNWRRFVTFWGLITALAMVVASTAPAADAARPIPTGGQVSFDTDCDMVNAGGAAGTVQLPSNGQRIGSWTFVLFENGNQDAVRNGPIENGNIFQPGIPSSFTDPTEAQDGVYSASILIRNRRGTKVLYIATVSTNAVAGVGCDPTGPIDLVWHRG